MSLKNIIFQSNRIVLIKSIIRFKSRNYIQERPTQIYANCVLYTVGGMYKTNPVPRAPTEVEGKGLKLGSALVNDFWTPPPPINFVHD